MLFINLIIYTFQTFLKDLSKGHCYAEINLIIIKWSITIHLIIFFTHCAVKLHVIRLFKIIDTNRRSIFFL